MTWRKWTSQTAFNTWHNRAKAALALPAVGVNADTGDPDPDAQLTTAYTLPVVLASNDVRAWVDPVMATRVPTGLGSVSTEPPQEVP